MWRVNPRGLNSEESLYICLLGISVYYSPYLTYDFLCYEFFAADSATSSTGEAIEDFYVVFYFLAVNCLFRPDFLATNINFSEFRLRKMR